MEPVVDSSVLPVVETPYGIVFPGVVVTLGVGTGHRSDVERDVHADGDQRVTAEQVAEWSNTISYEVLTAIGPRVKRRYSE